MPNYSDLLNFNGEIRTKEGQRFKDPSELAGYLGVSPHQIQWNKIEQRTLPPISSESSDEKTLPTGEKTLPVAEKPAELPKGGVDRLTAFRLAAKEAMRLSKAESAQSAFDTAEKGLAKIGYTPEKTSGNLMGNVINYVEGQINKPVETKFDTAMEMMAGQQKTAQLSLDTLIKTGVIKDMNDEDLQNLAYTAGMSQETLLTIRTAKKGNEGALNAFAKGIESGNVKLDDIPDDFKDEVAKRVKWENIKPEKPELKGSDSTGFYEQLWNSATKKYEYKQVIEAKPTGTNINVQTDNERALMTQFRGEQIVKDYNLVLTQKSAIDNYIKNGVGGPADLAMIFTFMKSLDPSSVVRETEYDTASKSGNIFQGVWAKFNGYFKAEGGILPDNVRKEFQNLVKQKFKGQEKLYENVAKEYTGIATRQGLNPKNVVIDYGEVVKPKTIDEYVEQNPEEGETVKTIIKENPNLSDDEILQILGFNSGGGGTPTAPKIAEAIGQFESGGNYKAVGKKTASGDRAYGKYQVMGNNIPSWTKEALGKSMTIDEFIKDTEAQDKVAQHKMQQYLDKYGNIEDVASVWFSGRPLSKAGNAKDVNGTTVPKYVDYVKSIYNKIA